jgi:hypothetical protein
MLINQLIPASAGIAGINLQVLIERFQRVVPSSIHLQTKPLCILTKPLTKLLTKPLQRVVPVALSRVKYAPHKLTQRELERKPVRADPQRHLEVLLIIIIIILIPRVASSSREPIFLRIEIDSTNLFWGFFLGGFTTA